MAKSDPGRRTAGRGAPPARAPTTKATTGRHPVDLHVGQAVRRLRRARGCSQTDLAQALGVTFQQVQKYERGANRISASRLLEIGRRLGVPAAYFFNGLAGQLSVASATLPPSSGDAGQATSAGG